MVLRLFCCSGITLSIRKTQRRILMAFIGVHFALAAVVNLVFFAGNAF
ncbi:MAG: hypothetical protein IPK17_39295 [Chloroflexi bacterium]|nr:hypothetical protein [Chloroflexota bacterium]